MYHSFLIYSSVDGHIGCFHVLAIINSAHNCIFLKSGKVNTKLMQKLPLMNVVCGVGGVEG